jgi:hypothetical protein
MSRDVPVVIQVMDLDADQAVVLDALIQEYIAEFDQQREASLIALAALDRDTMHAEWAPDDWTDWRDAWASVREKASTIDDPAAAAGWLASQRAWARRELAMLIASRADQTPSTRTDVLDAWLASRRALRDEFDRDVLLVLERDGVDRWALVQAAIYRQRSVFEEVLEGEQLDVGQLVRDVLANDLAVLAGLGPDLDAYETDWTAAAVRRDRVLEDLLPHRLDAEDRRDRVSMLALTARETEARAATMAVNQQWYERFSTLMPTEHVNDFQRRINAKWYPDIFLPSQPERIVSHVLSDTQTDELIRAATIDSRVRFGASRLRVAASERAARRASAGRRLTGRAEQQAMADVFGPTALFRLNDQAADESLANATALASRRREIDIAWLRHLHEVLGSTRWDTLPETVRLPPAVIRADRLDADGEPLRFRAAP